MNPFPHYTQHDQMDCGPTSLRMIAAWYGKRYSLEGLREKSFLTREGVSMLGISEAAERIGLRSMCVQVDYKTWWCIAWTTSMYGWQTRERKS